jgi:hypothetical protein
MITSEVYQIAVGGGLTKQIKSLKAFTVHVFYMCTKWRVIFFCQIWREASFGRFDSTERDMNILAFMKVKSKPDKSFALENNFNSLLVCCVVHNKSVMHVSTDARDLGKANNSCRNIDAKCMH